MGNSLLARSNELFRHHVIRRGRFRLYLAYSSFASWVPEAYPDFFCIGAPRAATTWVHKRLGRHPDVFIPRVKEVHFFDEPMEVDAPHRPVEPVPSRIFFDMNSPSHWRWYSLHYCRAGTRVKGDVTPEYSIISRRRIELIAERMPALKLIYILRNPVERAWSDACRPFMFKAPRVLRRPETLAEIRKEVMHPMMLKHGDYRAVIENWESLFDRSPDSLPLLRRCGGEAAGAACQDLPPPGPGPGKASPTKSSTAGRKMSLRNSASRRISAHP